MEHKKILILIPSRYHSSRFEGKPLADIMGKSLIQRVYEGCKSAGLGHSGKFDQEFTVCVVTDDQRIEDHVNGFNGKVVRVDEEVASGTLRIHMAYQKYFHGKDDYDVILNVQGDEPLVNGDDLVSLSEFHLLSKFSISTMVKEKSLKDRAIENPDKVKAIYSKESGRCFFFTRGVVPYDRESESCQSWFLHIGIYAYSPKSLSEYCFLAPSYYEKIEQLEQLRALENGMSIGAIETHHQFIGVDRPEDIEQLKGVLGGQNKIK